MWSGVWQRPHHHINWLDLRAVLVAVQLLQFYLRGKTAVFMIDNATTVSYLKKEGERSRALLKLSMRILRLAHRLRRVMVPRHIAGQLNVLADLASRTGQVIPSEWSLATESFQWVVNQSPWGPPQVDIFASSQNHKLRDYISPCPDPQAVEIDALNCLWPNKVLYAFPPTCIIPAIPPTSEGGTSVQGPPVSTLESASNVIGSPEQLSEETAPASTDIAGDTSSATLGPRASQPQAVDLHLVCLEK